MNTRDKDLWLGVAIGIGLGVYGPTGVQKMIADIVRPAAIETTTKTPYIPPMPEPRETGPDYQATSQRLRELRRFGVSSPDP